MYCAQNRIYCNYCNKSYLDAKYTNHLRSQEYINKVRKNHCT